uniref:Uncharacterized protein n=1 Tax=Knipowitschia caucasica TaxID=637954 RepID=A0AAV2L8V4_KNICA
MRVVNRTLLSLSAPSSPGFEPPKRVPVLPRKPARDAFQDPGFRSSLTRPPRLRLTRPVHKKNWGPSPFKTPLPYFSPPLNLHHHTTARHALPVPFSPFGLGSIGLWKRGGWSNYIDCLGMRPVAPFVLHRGRGTFGGWVWPLSAGVVWLQFPQEPPCSPPQKAPVTAIR